MRLPRSLAGRLLATAVAALAVALIVAGLAIAAVLERFVTHALDDRLDAQIAVAARAIRPDGTLDRRRAVDVPPFDAPGSGWAWEVRAPGGVLRSASLAGADLAPPPDARRRPPGPAFPPRPREGPRPYPFDGRDAAGAPIHGRALAIPVPGGRAELIAIGPRSETERPLRHALAPLLASLALLGVALALAILVQLRIGLRPLARLRAMVAEVRAGTRARVDADEPTELLPLVAELNALIDANREALARARGHVANLAHGLKTPLAALRLDLADGGHDPEGAMAAHVARMDRQIRHHLGRARAGTPAGAARAAIPLRAHLDDLVTAMARIHADRPIAADIRVSPSLLVACDPQDLDEMLGNLLDNGWRWARTIVRIAAERRGRDVIVTVADDGPGIAPADLPRVAEPGRRLDERDGGHGFGLAIARELAELHDGALRLDRAPGGGLLVTLVLPVGGAQTTVPV